MNLVIDIGNTIAKIAVFDSEDSIIHIKYSAITSLSELNQVCTKYAIKYGMVASVIDLTVQVQEQVEVLPLPMLWSNYTTDISITNLVQRPRLWVTIG